MPGENKTPIIVAAIALVGTIGAAVLANWDKLTSSNPNKPAATAPQPSISASQSITGNNNVQISGSNNIINPPRQPTPCRDKTHGVESYGRTFVTEKKSNWMGGGYSQDPWCNDVINELRAQHPDGAFKVLAKSEDSKTTCAPFNCPQYQYYCKVEAKVEPIFVEKLTSACK